MHYQDGLRYNSVIFTNLKKYKFLGESDIPSRKLPGYGAVIVP